MRFKYILILTIILTSLLAVSAVSATDIDTNDTQIASVSDNDEIVSMDSDLNELTDNEEGGNYSDLRMEIGSGGDKILTKKNYRYVDGDGDTIKIEQPGVIDGKGAVIDMAGSTIRVFNVTSSGVTIKNLTIKNVNYTGDGGGIYFSSSGNVTNCNFANNSARYGGAIYFSSSGTVINCNFINNTATQYGGAVYFNGNGTVTNCNFINNTATQYGGAVWMDSGSVENCNFTNNKVTSGRGGAVYFSSSGTVINCNFTNNSVVNMYGMYGGAVYFNGNGTVTNCNFINNTATQYGGAVYFSSSGTVINCNFINNTATQYGGAVYFSSSGTVINCNFTNNKATGDYTCGGGAIFFVNTGTVTNCNFINNTATGHGGAVYFSSSGTVINCTFINNSALVFIAVYPDYSVDYVGGDGGAVYFCDCDSVENCSFINNTATTGNGGAFYAVTGGSVKNCNFTNNTATNGGAIILNSDTITNCSFFNNTATQDGGAVYLGMASRCSVENCTFINNSALGISNKQGYYTGHGGAVYFNGAGSFYVKVKNCNFINNSALGIFKKQGYYTGHGGAVHFQSQSIGSSVENCNFTNNNATNGGAVYFRNVGGTVTNCNFIDNTATGDGGAVYFYSYYSSYLTNCNFIDNNATNGGAVYFKGYGNVTNCNFTGNNATTGSASYFSAIYFSIPSSNIIVSNSIFLNNRANSEALEITKNDDNITITFKGKDNLLNAIYSEDDVEVRFINVTYWSANGINKTGSFSIPSRSKNEAGQNISVGVVVNGELVLSEVKVTDENGMIVLDISAGENYFIGIRHDPDSYYTEAEKIISNNTELNVNVTSQTTTNRTVNITAKSNIPNEIIKGKLLFILPNGTEISANYNADGTWWAVHTFEDIGDYEINAYYSDGFDDVTVNNATISIRINVPINVNNINIFFDDVANVIVSVPEALNGQNITITVNGTSKNSIVKNGNATASFADLPAGEHIINVDYSGDGINSANSTTAKLTVSKVDTVIVVNTAFSRYATDYYSDGTKDGVNGERGGFFYATLYDVNGNPLVNKTVQIAINGPIYNVTTDENGQAGLQVNLAKANTYTYALYFPGDEGYSASLIASSKLTVVKKPTSIIANSKYAFKSSAKTKTVTVALNTIKNPFNNELYLKAGKKVTLTVNGKTYSAKTDSKGVAKFNIKLTKKGTYTATVKFAGDSTYESASKSIKIVISSSAKSNAALKGVGIGTDPKELDNPSALNIEGNYADYVANSNISTSYAGPAKKATIIAVDKNFTRNATDYYSDGTKDGVNGERGGFFYATLTDTDGNPLANKTVQIAVNGPIYNVTTDEYGQAGLQVNLAKANTYTYALSFSGDEEYCPAMLASSKLTVIKKPITIDVKGLSFKANAKTKTVTVTLKTIKNEFDGKTYLKDGKKVTLKVNGVTYTGFIKDGVVKFNVKLAKKGTYRAVVGFAGDSTYGSASKTVSIKVK